MKKFGLGMTALVLWVVLICMPAQTLASSTSSKAGGSAAAFYRGKTVEFIVTNVPGGGYDTAARLLTPFLEKYLGATVIVRNEPGAGGKVALNRLARENNGLSIIIFPPRATGIAQIFGEPGVGFDLTKFNWLGIVAKSYYPLIVGKKSGYKSISDLQHAKKEAKFGSDTRTSGKAIRPLVMGHIFGINVKLVAGYKGSADEILALLREEVDGISPPVPVILPYVNTQDALPLFMMAPSRHNSLPNTPTIYEVKKLSAPEKRIVDIAVALDAVGRPMATTPGVPKDRVAFLESALKKTLEEPELRKKYEKMLGEPIDYSSGKGTTEAIITMMSMSGDEKTLFGKLLGIEGY
ncbi:MAG: tripartite tricarboxylate transporter substrate-binding protein [bacterium]|nr:tripartite tricarboxylate transporter substrate-binding protein [bacterium]